MGQKCAISAVPNAAQRHKPPVLRLLSLSPRVLDSLVKDSHMADSTQFAGYEARNSSVDM
jgi:hypothetical protein